MSSMATLLTRGSRAHYLQKTFPSPLSLLFRTRASFRSSARPLIAQCRSAKPPTPFLFKAAGVATLGLGLSNLTPQIHCDAPSLSEPPVAVIPELPPPPKSSVSLYQLSFGTVAGVCAGIFIKKGAKAAAFLLGGIFVLLQYLASAAVIRVDWGRVASKFEDMFYISDASVTGESVTGESAAVEGAKEESRHAPTIATIWTWLVDFLTADFQPRASFIAGLALGLRIG